MLVIRGEQLLRELEEIAEREKRSVEAVLRSMVAQYPVEPAYEDSWDDKEDGVPRLKNELLSDEPPPGSLAYAAMIAERGNL